MSDASVDDANTLLAVADAAVVWWVMKRPVVWSREKHWENPTVNCAGDVEHLLAKAACKWSQLNDAKRTKRKESGK